METAPTQLISKKHDQTNRSERERALEEPRRHESGHCLRSSEKARGKNERCLCARLDGRWDVPVCGALAASSKCISAASFPYSIFCALNHLELFFSLACSSRQHILAALLELRARGRCCCSAPSPSPWSWAPAAGQWGGPICKCWPPVSILNQLDSRCVTPNVHDASLPLLGARPPLVSPDQTVGLSKELEPAEDLASSAAESKWEPLCSGVRHLLGFEFAKLRGRSLSSGSLQTQPN